MGGNNRRLRRRGMYGPKGGNYQRVGGEGKNRRLRRRVYSTNGW